MSFTDNEKAVVALTTRLGDNNRPSLSPTAWAKLATRLADAGREPASLFRTVDGLALDDDLTERVSTLIGSVSAALVEADEWQHRGVWIQTVVSDRYPARLADKLGPLAPPVIFGVGELAITNTPGIGVVGSRNVSPEGAEVAQAIGPRAVELGLPVVSGAARGVDQLAMNAAFNAGGQVVGVLADALSKKMRDAVTLRAIDDGSICLIAQQHPKTGFSAGNAMCRNKLIYALASTTVVIATDHNSGGTWSGATEALKKGYGRVLVWRGVGHGQGNAALERLGAVPVQGVDDLRMNVPAQAEEPMQLTLMDG